jgi:hypothetical protein
VNIHLNLIFLGYSIKTIFAVELHGLRCIYALLCNKLEILGARALHL